MHESVRITTHYSGDYEMMFFCDVIQTNSINIPSGEGILTMGSVNSDFKS